MDRRLWWAIVILVIFGLVMLASAGVVDGQRKFGSPYYYVKHQFLFGVLPGLALMYILSRVDYRIWKKLSWLILAVALALMILVFVPGIGLALNNARSWISFYGLTFQPVEALKLALVVYLAAWFGGKEDRVRNLSYGVAPFLVIMAFVALLLMLQPDLGGLGLVVLIALAVYLVAGVPLKHFLALCLVGLVAVSGFILVEPYRLDRVKALINPSIDPRGSSYQLNQSLIAIGSGGLFGVGYGNSRQKFGFLPETVNDSIFAIIAEELGLVGAGLTIGLFLFLIFTLMTVARRAHDRFAKLYVTGIAAWIAIQAVVNIAAISGIGPLTGIPLPFISFGGTALVTLLAGLGIALNVAKRV